MALTLTISDSVATALRVPEQGREEALRVELALALYADGLLSLGKARELAGLGKLDFARVLGRHRIPRQYEASDLEADLAYGRGQ